MKDTWKNRRRMAWISMLSGVAFPLLILSTESETLGQISMPFYAFVTGVVMTYISAATYEDTKGVANARHENNADSDSNKFSNWDSSRMDCERMAAQRQDKPYDSGTVTSTRRSGKERYAGVSKTSEAKRRGS